MFPVPVPEHFTGVLFVDGKLHQLLEPGLYAFLRFNPEVRAACIDLRQQAIEVAGQ